MAITFTRRETRSYPVDWLRQRLLAERERWILWLPVALALGIGIYFGLPYEPWLLFGWASLASSLILLIVLRNQWVARIGLLGLFAISLGFIVAQWRTHDVAENVLNRALSFTTVEGLVMSAEPAVHGARVIRQQLRDHRMGPLEQGLLTHDCGQAVVSVSRRQLVHLDVVRQVRALEKHGHKTCVEGRGGATARIAHPVVASVRGHAT